jgi:hypothetical protein
MARSLYLEWWLATTTRDRGNSKANPNKQRKHPDLVRVTACLSVYVKDPGVAGLDGLQHPNIEGLILFYRLIYKTHARYRNSA